MQESLNTDAVYKLITPFDIRNRFKSCKQTISTKDEVKQII